MTHSGPEALAATIVDGVLAQPRPDSRALIAIAGPPAVGKSTVAERVVAQLQARGHGTGFVPMDGFHMDNAQLDALGLRARKGAPDTFDLPGFAAVVSALEAGGTTSVPLFDREADRVVPNASEVPAEARFVVLEGNYLLFDADGWRDLHAQWSFSAFITNSIEVLQARLVERWTDHGFDPAQALAKATSNDLPNAARVLAHRLPSDLTLTS